MPQLTSLEKATFRDELQNHIINCVLDAGCPSPNLSRSIQRSIGSRKKYFGGGHVDKLYQKHFNRDPNKVYEYIVRNYSGLLDSAGIDYVPVAPKPDPAPDPQPAPQKPIENGTGGTPPAMVAGFELKPIYLAIAAVIGFIIYRAQ